MLFSVLNYAFYRYGESAAIAESVIARCVSFATFYAFNRVSTFAFLEDSFQHFYPDLIEWRGDVDMVYEGGIQI